MWKESHQFFEVEAATAVTPNLLTFQLVTGYERFYVMGIYIPPNDTTGVDALRTAWAACPANCTLLIMGDLNINFEHPRDAREEDIADLLDEINWLIRPARSFYDGVDYNQQRNAGRGDRSGWGDGITPSQTTSWPGRGIFGTFGRLLSGCHGCTIPTIERSS